MIVEEAYARTQRTGVAVKAALEWLSAAHAVGATQVIPALHAEYRRAFDEDVAAINAFLRVAAVVASET